MDNQYGNANVTYHVSICAKWNKNKCKRDRFVWIRHKVCTLEHYAALQLLIKKCIIEPANILTVKS